jgi:hypothetical protein
MGNIERESERSENQPYVPWWKELPSEQTLRTVVFPKVPDSADEHLSTEKKIDQALTRHSQAVQGIKDYLQATPDSFSHKDKESISEMKQVGGLFGGLLMTLTPVHCDNLMQSGLVEVISPDIDLPLIP